MLGEHDRGPPLLVEPAQHAEQLVARDGIELRGRLVEQHEPRAAGERRAERHALELAARELVRRAVEQRRDAERERRLLHPARDRGGRQPAVLEREGELAATVPMTTCVSGSWNSVPATAASAPGPCSRVSSPPTSSRPANSPPWKCGTSPQAARSSVDLPEPLAPARTTNSPGAIARSRRAARARPRPGTVGDALERSAAHGAIPRRSANGSSAQTRERAQSASARRPTGASSDG